MLESFSESHYDTYTQLVAFYLTARFFMAAYCALTAFLLPMVGGMMYSMIILAVVPSALWIGSIHAHGSARFVLVFIALGIDLFGQSFVYAPYRWSRKHPETMAGKRISRFFEFYPAINIEHKVERTNAFVTLVIGYSVVALIYQNAGFGINDFLGKAMLGLVQAFIFNWIYFEVDGANIHVHAIRRSARAGKFCPTY
jgi:low temperature requirement protein LtrA